MSVEIISLYGSVFDRSLQDELGLDSLAIFRKHGFNPMEVFTGEYLEDPNPRIDREKTLVYNMCSAPKKGMVYGIVSRQIDAIAALGGNRVGISQLEYSERDGSIIDDSRADEWLKQCVERWVEEKGESSGLESIAIMIDNRCKSITL